MQWFVISMIEIFPSVMLYVVLHSTQYTVHNILKFVSLSLSLCIGVVWCGEPGSQCCAVLTGHLLLERTPCTNTRTSRLPASH